MNLNSSTSRQLRGFVLGVAVALAGGTGLAAWAQPHGGGHHERGGMMMGGSPRHVERMLDAVNASDAQRAQVRQIAEAAAADMKAQHEAGRALREQQIKLFTQPTVDANAVEALRQQQLAQHDQSSKRMTQAMLEISRVLTPEQRGKLAERMQARRELMQRHQHERQQLDKAG